MQLRKKCCHFFFHSIYIFGSILCVSHLIYSLSVHFADGEDISHSDGRLNYFENSCDYQHTQSALSVSAKIPQTAFHFTLEILKCCFQNSIFLQRTCFSPGRMFALIY